MLDEFYAAIGALVRSDGPAEEALSHAFDELKDLKDRGAKRLTYGECLNTVFSALAVARPSEAVPLKIQFVNRIWTKLTRTKLFVQSTADMASDYRRFSAVFSELFRIMQDDWNWQPQDWLDIQGFLWIVDDNRNETYPTQESPVPISPTNLILYGPPGTGKTYRTAAEAVTLCREKREEDRETLIKTYQRLVAERRIEFVTFHQSMSYEEFVEGNQPTTTSDGNDDSSSTGFRLETVPGIFRQIAKRAETSRGRAKDEDAVTVAGTAGIQDVDWRSGQS